MNRLVWSTLFVLAACGSQDDRPLELEYLTQAIFAPSCGPAQCHSTFKQEANNVFDTPEGVRRSLVENGLVRLGSTKYDPDDAANAELIIWITETDPFGLGKGRMPNDAPLPNQDVYLLREWIEHETPGAQCNPEANDGKACDNKVVVQCNADWTFGTRVMVCTGDCEQGKCL